MVAGLSHKKKLGEVKTSEVKDPVYPAATCFHRQKWMEG